MSLPDWTLRQHPRNNWKLNRGWGMASNSRASVIKIRHDPPYWQLIKSVPSLVAVLRFSTKGCWDKKYYNSRIRYFSKMSLLRKLNFKKFLPLFKKGSFSRRGNGALDETLTCVAGSWGENPEIYKCLIHRIRWELKKLRILHSKLFAIWKEIPKLWCQGWLQI